MATANGRMVATGIVVASTIKTPTGTMEAARSTGGIAEANDIALSRCRERPKRLVARWTTAFIAASGVAAFTAN